MLAADKNIDGSLDYPQESALMSARSNGVEWGETVEEVVIIEERLTPENNSPEGDKKLPYGGILTGY